MDSTFEGRVAVVTGAAGGLGRHISFALAARGAAILANDLGTPLTGKGASSPSVVGEFVEELRRTGARAEANTASVATDDGAQSVIEDALRHFGRVDIVVNLAGITDPKPFEQMSMDDLRRAVDIMFYGSAGVIHAAWPHMQRQGYGRVLTALSGSIFGLPGYSGYVAAKGALFALTRTLAVEGRDHGILVNGFAPVAATRMTLENPELKDIRDWIEKTFATERAVPVMLYLISEACKLNGAVLGTGGGHVTAWKFGETAGIIDRHHTQADIAARIDELIDIEKFLAFDSQADQAAYQAGVVTQTLIAQMKD